MLQKLRNTKGFTLLEVMIVTVIFAIFFTVIFKIRPNNKTQPTNPKPAVHQTIKNKKL